MYMYGLEGGYCLLGPSQDMVTSSVDYSHHQASQQPKTSDSEGGDGLQNSTISIHSSNN